MSDTSWWVDKGDSTSHCCWVKSLMNFVKVAWGTTGIQILKYLGTESSPWSGLLGLHLIVTTVARPFSHEVVTVEDLIWNKRKNVQSEICFHYRKSTLRCHSGSCSVLILLSQGINLARKQDRTIKKQNSWHCVWWVTLMEGLWCLRVCSKTLEAPCPETAEGKEYSKTAPIPARQTL